MNEFIDNDEVAGVDTYASIYEEHLQTIATELHRISESLGMLVNMLDSVTNNYSRAIRFDDVKRK